MPGMERQGFLVLRYGPYAPVASLGLGGVDGRVGRWPDGESSQRCSVPRLYSLSALDDLDHCPPLLRIPFHVS